MGGSCTAKIPGIRKNDLLAGPRGRRALALLHGHQVADVGQHGLQVRHLLSRTDQRPHKQQHTTIFVPSDNTSHPPSRDRPRIYMADDPVARATSTRKGSAAQARPSMIARFRAQPTATSDCCQRRPPHDWSWLGGALVVPIGRGRQQLIYNANSWYRPTTAPRQMSLEYHPYEEHPRNPSAYA